MYEYKKPYILDFSNVRYYSEMQKVIKEEFDFPDYYGENWDAFWDCLTDMTGREIHIKIIGLERIERKFGSEIQTMIDILKEFKHYHKDRYCDRIRIEIVSGNTVVELA